MPIGAQSSLEYIIRVIFEKQGAMQAEQSINRLAQKNLASMQKIDKGTKETGRSYEAFTRTVKGVQTPMMRVNQQFTNSTGKVTESSRAYRLAGESFQKVGKEAKLSTVAVGKQSEGIKGLAAGYAKLALRAVSVIPIWMVLRTVFSTVQKLVSDSVKTWMELNKEMGRVATVTRGTATDITRLRNEILTFSASASRGFKEAASAMYALGSAGLDVREQIAGMRHIMNVTIGTFGNAEQIAKLVAGAYNVFGDSIEGVSTTSEKFKHISDMLAYTYSKQQVELSEIANAMTYVASIGSLMNISFDTLVTTIGVLNTGMLKGSKSGTALMNAFVKLAVSGDRLAKLGVIFDPNQPLDFLDIMTQLHNIFGSQALSLQNLKEIMDVFGRRGGRAAAQLIKDFDRWKKSIDDTEAEFKDFAEYMKETAETTLPGAWAKMWNAIKADIAGALGEGKKFALLIDVLAEKMERGRVLREYGRFREVSPAFGERVAPAVGRGLGGGILGAIAEEALAGRAREAEKESILRRKTILDLYNEAERNVGKIVDKKTKEISIDETLNNLAEAAVEHGYTEVQVEAKLFHLMDTELGMIKAEGAIRKEFLKLLKEELSIREKEVASTIRLQEADKKKFEDIRNAARYELMSLKNVRESTIERTKLVDMVERINIEIDKTNKKEKGAAATEKRLVEFSLQRLDITSLLTGETEDLIAAYLKIGGSQKNILSIEKQRLETQRAMVAEVEKFSSELETAFSGIFKDVLLGEEQMINVFQRMGDSMRDIMAGAIAESFSKALMATGMGEAFGTIGVNLETMFQTPAEQMRGAIKGAVDESAPILKEQGKEGIVEGAEILKQTLKETLTELFTDREKKAFLPPGGGGPFPLAGYAPTGGIESARGYLEEAGIGYKIEEAGDDFRYIILDAGEEMGRIGGKELKKGAEDSNKIMQQGTKNLLSSMSTLFSKLPRGGVRAAGVAGVAGVGGIAGATGALGAAFPFLGQPVGGIKPGMYSDLRTGQLMTAAGKPAGPTYGQMFGGAVTGALTGYSQYQAMRAGGMSPGYSAAAGGLMGVGGLMMAIPGFQLAGGILMAGSMLMQMFGKREKTRETTVETRTQTKQVTSRIDISNKQLELVNRNLLALKDEITYIMQASYYFRERNVEDRFAIDSQRGNM